MEAVAFSLCWKSYCSVECTTKCFGCGMPQHTNSSWRYFQPHECRQPFALTVFALRSVFRHGFLVVCWREKHDFTLAPIELWEVDTDGNIPTLEKFATLPGHPTVDIQDLAFSPDNTLLASASFDGRKLFSCGI